MELGKICEELDTNLVSMDSGVRSLGFHSRARRI